MRIKEVKYSFFASLALLVLVTSCSKYEKLLKGNDNDAKYRAALTYYEAGKYRKAIPLFEAVEPINRGTPKDDSTRFLLAKSYFLDKDPFTAEYYFGSFKTTFPRSPFAQEAYFLHGVCLYEASYRAQLDQGPTEKAIIAFNEYLYTYPNSPQKGEAQAMMDELVLRLVKKSYLNARFYADIEDYKAAVTALRTSLKDYPESEYREEILYLIHKSSYLYAHHSVREKQKDRYQASIDNYYNFISEYPNSKYLKEVQSMYKVANEMIAADRKHTEAEAKKESEGNS